MSRRESLDPLRDGSKYSDVRIGQLNLTSLLMIVLHTVLSGTKTNNDYLRTLENVRLTYLMYQYVSFEIQQRY